MSTTTKEASKTAAPSSTSAPHPPPPRPTHIDTSDRELSKDLTSPTSPSTEHSAADAQRAMESTGAWQPSFTRRQSFSQQEYKHLMQMSKVGDDQPCLGFTERAS